MSDITKRLQNAAEEIANEGIAGWGNLCSEASDHIADLERQLKIEKKAKEIAARQFMDSISEAQNLKHQLLETQKEEQKWREKHKWNMEILAKLCEEIAKAAPENYKKMLMKEANKLRIGDNATALQPSPE